ncbi:ABC transporter permease [Humibacter sp. BT305]|nr:ABC transporter permease [Humibacter sp. BT305]
MTVALGSDTSEGVPRYTGRKAPWGARLRRALLTPSGAVFVLLALLLVALFALNPGLAGEGQFTRFLGRAAPLAVVALGQYFVIVCGELDLSMGAVISAQVVLAGNLIGLDDTKILPVLLLMAGLAVVVGVVNGLVVTLLRVPSFIATLGTALVISGLTFYSTGGAPSGNPTDTFRAIGRSGIDGVPVLGFLPYSVIVLVVLLAAAILLMRSPFGRMLMAAGDNPRATGLTGASVTLLRVRAFVISAIASTVAAVLLIGYAGVSPVVGQGYEFTAITAVVLGGVALSGGRGWVASAFAGALVLEVLFSLLDFAGVESTWRPAVQGAIIVAAIGVPLVRWTGLASALRRRRAVDRSIAPSEHIGQSGNVAGTERG